MTEPGFDMHEDSALPSWAAAVPSEARAFQGHRAGFVTRALAVGIDFAVVAVSLLLVYLGWAALLFVVRPTNYTLPTVSFGLLLAASAAGAWLYFTVAWSTTGRTVGAKVMGIRVVNYRGKVMRLGGAAARAAFCLGFMPGLFWVIVSDQNRSLQDTVMRTSVIYDWTSRPAQRESHHAPAEDT